MLRRGERFDEIWLVDFEFQQPPGENPSPICLVAKELFSGRMERLFGAELRARRSPPFRIDRRSLVVAYYAIAEMSCFLALGWPTPHFLLDLFTEFRRLTNGNGTTRNNLVYALSYFGLDPIDSQHKESMRRLAMRGEPYDETERRALLSYCESDVLALGRLLGRLAPHLDDDRSLMRGAFMATAASIEATGVPIDVDLFSLVSRHLDSIRKFVIDREPVARSLFDGLSFRVARFTEWLDDHGIDDWPRFENGHPKLDDDTFEEMSRAHPVVEHVATVRDTLAKLKHVDLRIGADGRSRCMLSAFQSKTGRNQPSSSQFLFGMPSWMRGFCQPKVGSALVHVDWKQQEFGIAAGLSGDRAMREAYTSDDPYLEFAKQARMAPLRATRRSHPELREQFKQCVLAVQYGMGSKELARRIGRDEPFARNLLEVHRRTYSTFWSWSDRYVDLGAIRGSVETVFGWTMKLGARDTERTIRNFPMQANGAEMLRRACCLAIDRGVKACAPIHDAILVEAPETEAQSVALETEACMRQASRDVLGDFELGTDKKVVIAPERLCEPRGAALWSFVTRTAAALESKSETVMT
jgi:DNA polymerase-1